MGIARKETTLSYRRVYDNITMMSGGGNILNQTDFTPEVKYYTDRALLDEAFPSSSLNFTNIRLYMDDDHLFNQETWGNLLLPKPVKTKDSLKEFNNPQFKRYLKYVAFQAGLNGLFTCKTPRQIIEGYEDPLVKQLAGAEVYLGGDQTQSPFLSSDKSPTNPSDNTVEFLSGDTPDSSAKSYLFTRQYVGWLGRENIVMRRQDYKTINAVEDVYSNPWREKI